MARRYIDLNIASLELAGFARSLGWSEALSMKSIRLSSEEELSRLFSAKDLGLAAVESEDADFLKRALKSKKYFLINPTQAKDFHRDDVLARAASEARIPFEIPFYDFLNAYFVRRAKAITQLTAFLRMCTKFKASYVFTSRAKTRWDVKSPREAVALAQLFGLTYEQAARAISEAPQEVLEQVERA